MNNQENDKLKGIREHILFLGNRNDVHRLYNAMDIFVLPSRYEGLPVVGVEAQANGLPCLLSDKMTKETKMTENAEFLSIGDGAEEWAKRIYLCFENIREDNKKCLTECGFSINQKVEYLINYYFGLI